MMNPIITVRFCLHLIMTSNFLAFAWIKTIPTGCHYGNGGSSCCSSSNQCLEGEGDCDDSNDCIGNLQCGHNNCDKRLGFNSHSDCCYGPKCK